MHMTAQGSAGSVFMGVNHLDILPLDGCRGQKRLSPQSAPPLPPACLICFLFSRFYMFVYLHESEAMPGVLAAQESYIRSLCGTSPDGALRRCLWESLSQSHSSSPGPSPALTTDPVKPHSRTSLDPPRPGARAKPQTLDRPEQSQAEPGRARPIKNKK